MAKEGTVSGGSYAMSGRSWKKSKVGPTSCMAFFNAGNSSALTSAKDVEVAEPPNDSISSLAFSPQAGALPSEHSVGYAHALPRLPGGQLLGQQRACRASIDALSDALF